LSRASLPVTQRRMSLPRNPKHGDDVPTEVVTDPADLNVAPGSIVVVRDEEWLVTSAEQGADGWLVRVRGLSELVAETTAAFYSSLDSIEVQDPSKAKVVAWAGGRVAVVFDEGEPVDGWTVCPPDADDIVQTLNLNGVV
jgi:hypothetical protein